MLLQCMLSLGAYENGEVLNDYLLHADVYHFCGLYWEAKFSLSDMGVRKALGTNSLLTLPNIM